LGMFPCPRIYVVHNFLIQDFEARLPWFNVFWISQLFSVVSKNSTSKRIYHWHLIKWGQFLASKLPSTSKH
jgi:hypothetical protein